MAHRPWARAGSMGNLLDVVPYREMLEDSRWSCNGQVWEPALIWQGDVF